MNDLGTARRRVRGYWFIDGFQEIASGTGLSVSGALFLAAAMTSDETFATVGIVLLAACAMAAFVGVRAAKGRVTYVRTGWVRRPKAIMLAKAVAVVAWVAIAIPLMATYERSGRVDIPLTLAVTGAAVGIGAAWQAWRTGQRRFYVQAVCVTVTGVAAALGGLSFRAGFSAILLVCGLTLLLNGTYALAAYLRKNPAPQLDEVAS
jgi:hypothetical protein